jgi:hypothetical protein
MTTVVLGPVAQVERSGRRSEATTAGEPADPRRRLAGAQLRVVVDLAHRDGSRRRARYGLRGRQVTALATHGDAVGATMFDVSRWQSELARLIEPPAREPAGPAPMAGLELPWDLMVGSGTALRCRRSDLYDALVARAVGLVSVRGHPVPPTACHEQLRRLHHSVLARMRATGTGRGRIGWLSWLRYPDGWLALAPYVAPDLDGPRAMVRLEPRMPEQLGVEVARWAAVMRE